jgi:hypothetical protein
MSKPTGSFVAMSHESHGFCFCGEVHCSGERSCGGGCMLDASPSAGDGLLRNPQE